MTFVDDDLAYFEAGSLHALPTPTESGLLDTGNARIWYASFGAGGACVAYPRALAMVCRGEAVFA
ncbi:MAG: hypothetical protein HY834_03260 [Devosia nanyangense]|uniref:Uncharacterized protein n=1 Tax=Devosia nanyangense TaxID=1228055 RepID=A0A933L1B9_9HYPH|nr:hypothetical protein [Devosia nanyangense]